MVENKRWLIHSDEYKEFSKEFLGLNGIFKYFGISTKLMPGFETIGNGNESITSMFNPFKTTQVIIDNIITILNSLYKEFTDIHVFINKQSNQLETQYN